MTTAKLTGRTALITGASKGLGKAMALALAQAGARVVLVSRNREQLNETAAAVRKCGAEAFVFQTDVAEEDQVLLLERGVIEQCGKIQILINNAGITKHVPHADLDGLSAEDFQRLFGVNTIGPFQMIRAARAQLEAGAKTSRRPSAVVNVSSVAGISGGGSTR